MSDGEWISLPLEEWRDTRATLHMYTQVIGKLRMTLSPFEPGWANVPLYVTARGLTTSPMRAGSRTLDAELDLVDHALVVRCSDGLVERRPLGGSVAEFYRDVMHALQRMRVDVSIPVIPSEVPDPIPFPDDRTHDTYDPEQASRFQRVLSMVDIVMKEHHARFLGRTTPVQFFWGTFDLSLTRYSGRAAEPLPHAGVIARFSSEAEEICAGWWPGDVRIPYPAFYAYAHPAPLGVESSSIAPDAAEWSSAAGEFLLPYEAVRIATDPRQAILDFLASTYDAAATLGDWSSGLTHFSTPGPESRRGANSRR